MTASLPTCQDHLLYDLSCLTHLKCSVWAQVYERVGIGGQLEFSFGLAGKIGRRCVAIRRGYCLLGIVVDPGRTVEQIVDCVTREQNRFTVTFR